MALLGWRGAMGPGSSPGEVRWWGGLRVRMRGEGEGEGEGEDEDERRGRGASGSLLPLWEKVAWSAG